MTALLLIVGFFLFLHIYGKIGAISARVDFLERKVVEGRVPSAHTASPAPVDAVLRQGVSGELGGGAMQFNDEVTPRPAPRPAPHAPVDTESPSVPPKPEESSEERSARWLGWIGAIAVLGGVAFFLKYAFDNRWIEETGRVALGILAGLSMVGIGHYLRTKSEKYLRYSDVVIGGGIGVLYLSIYASFGFYHLVPQGTAFLLMALVTVFGLVLSITGNSRMLAILAIAGGFTSFDGRESPVHPLVLHASPRSRCSRGIVVQKMDHAQLSVIRGNTSSLLRLDGTALYKRATP
jgi:hypothetical protein